MNYFEQLNSVNVSDKAEKKNGLTYLSWAWAWAEVKKRHPLSYYTIYENADGLFYHTDGNTCWVKTGVTVVADDMAVEHIEYLPVMDFRNKSIPLDKVTSMDVNTSIQRSLTKAVARHGLGLYIYAGEDLPESELPPGVETAVLPKGKATAKITAVTTEEIKERKAELKGLLDEKGKTMDEYKAIAGERTVTSMTPEEYQEWFKSLKKAWS